MKEREKRGITTASPDIKWMISVYNKICMPINLTTKMKWKILLKTSMFYIYSNKILLYIYVIHV